LANERLSPLAWLGIALVLGVVLMGVFAALSMSTTGGSYGMMGGGMWGWGAIFMIVPAVILVLVLIIALGGLSERVTYPMPVAVPAASPASALEILEARYARGELSREEYLRTRSDLEVRAR
jgi:putative membrane protein